MEFFIPAADSPEQAAQVYGAVRKFLGDELGAEFGDRKVRSLRWRHDGRELRAAVGEPLEQSGGRVPGDVGVGEVVIAILYEPGRDLYHVCTPNRGVVRGMSILAGGSSALAVVDFDE